jgi:L,D-transpeptidase ErfK/SrfK
MTNTNYFSKVLGAIGILLLVSTQPALSKTFALPSGNDTIIGQSTYITSSSGETLTKIASRFDIGMNEITDANPGIIPNAGLPSGLHIKIPTAFLLPNLPHNGIVINLPEMRMYYFPATMKDVVRTYPIGIGRVGKTIPLAHTYVVRKATNPVWIPPADIRAFNEDQGIVLPHVMPAGPDNPLGPFAIYLGLPTYLIHSTIYPDSVGRRASFGCIRMHEDDIKDFFPLVTAKTSVTIVDMPTKVGWAGNYLFIEAHQPLVEHNTEYQATFDGMIGSIDKATSAHPTFVDWQLVGYLGEQRDGIPHEIGFVIH